MKTRHWLTPLHQGILLMALACAVIFQAYANDDASEMTDQQRLELLIEKFEQGDYSKKGADSCLKCHDQESDIDSTGIFTNRHGGLTDKLGPFSKLQCESCHGPLGRHDKRPRKGQDREPMIDFAKNSYVTSELKNSVCLGCHQNDHQQMGWFNSEHNNNDVACSDCHKVHELHDPMLVKTSQNKQCTSCHTKQKIDIHKRSAHPIKNDRQVCSDCHNPHDSLNDASLIAATVNDSCIECHSEKRGPFLWEHEPVIEDCSNCHEPHGANNAMLLKRRVPQLCQQCHSSVGHTSAAYVEAVGVRVQGKSCLNCHNQIHGSNHPTGDLFSK
ncbi:DmsE family decaheme c-type cytochrome [Thalassotalea aquiviva]|uniref:DmsE family decaheme c-type cytochrome n=1 Tax=Thalassotalea aquiviva TaxID=3242415 RepID=UPI00352A2DC7